MIEFNLTEGIGYLAMLLVAVSIMMNNLKWLRVFNLSGAIVFIIYGLVIASYPIVILNAFLAIVNTYYLVKPKKEA